jgi:UDP-3-O-[3-hydroxymyristoyl] glucosamine N-acyltransferase
LPRSLPTPTTAGDLAHQFNLELRGDAATAVTSVASLYSADVGSLTFFSDKKLTKLVADCAASAIIAPADCELRPGVAHLISPAPHTAFANLLQQLFPSTPQVKGLEGSYYADVTASLDDVIAQEYCGIGAGSSIAPGTVLQRGVQVGRNVRIGRDCMFYPGVVIYDDVVIGDRCIVHANTVIGSDGFGYQPSKSGWVKVPQVGSVVIGNDVEIGANCAIDRGAIENTIVGDGVKIDNLVQIAHNVRIGEHTAIAACAGIAGSATVGARCMIGGAAMIIGHLEICDDVVISGGTLVSESIRTPGRYTAVFPYAEHREWMRMAATLRRSAKKKSSSSHS